VDQRIESIQVTSALAGCWLIAPVAEPIGDTNPGTTATYVSDVDVPEPVDSVADTADADSIADEEFAVA
jgi:hypothetical protein